MNAQHPNQVACQWNQVQHRMPLDGDNVIIYCPDLVDPVCPAYHSRFGWMFAQDVDVLGPVTHWMAMPEAPQV